MASITDALNAATNALRLVTPQPLSRAEHASNNAQLTKAIQDARDGLREADKSIKQKDIELQQLSQIRTQLQQTVPDGGYLYEKAMDKLPTGLPYCPRCLTQKFQLVGLTIVDRKGTCPDCRSKYDRIKDHGSAQTSSQRIHQPPKYWI